MKNSQRIYMRRLRNAISPSEAVGKSRAVLERFVGTDFYKNSSVIMLYLSAKNEVDTLELARKILADGKKAVVPITNVSDNTLTLSYISSLDDLCEGAFGILEPKTVNECAASEIDVVIVPGLVFDIHGGRIGYGKGYYDRFFEDTDAMKIAFCYDFQLVDKAAIEPHDVPMDFIITESRIINCDEI